jgi:hypothetical protein
LVIGNPLKEISKRYSKIWADSRPIISELLRENTPAPGVSVELNRWLETTLSFLGECSDQRLSATLRHEALYLFRLAMTRKVEFSEFLIRAIGAFPGTFPFKIGKNESYQFHADYFSPHIENWTVDLDLLVKRRNNQILEIGSFEGFSTCWLLEHLIRGNKARITCVDFFDKVYFPAFKANITKTGKRSQVRIKRGHSRDILRKLTGDAFDFIYIDGSHLAADAIEDMVLSWPLLKDGGIMILDDYDSVDEAEISMRDVVDFFLRCHEGQFDLIRKGYQVTVRKKLKRRV